jgi:hypothetical protein
MSLSSNLTFSLTLRHPNSDFSKGVDFRKRNLEGTQDNLLPFFFFLVFTVGNFGTRNSF